MRVLLIEDDVAMARSIELMLRSEGFNVYTTDLGEEGVDLGKLYDYDIIVLDLQLPDMSGFDVLKALRLGKLRTPVMILSGNAIVETKVKALGFGADDYMTKPFSPRVLLARIKAILRRKHKESADNDQAIHVHELVIHPGRHEVLMNGNPIELTFTEFRLLHFLARKPGWAFSRSQIVDAVKGEDYPVTERSVDVQVAGLRKKLGEIGSYIETVRGVGYRFKE